MTRMNLFDCKYDELTISKAITDGMWKFQITIDKDYPSPSLWEPVHAIKEVNGEQICLFIGFPTSKQKCIRDGDEYWDISGHSYGWYLNNRPLRPAERMMTSTQNGPFITIEDPITYLNRLIFANNSNPCGLVKGIWDTSTEKWGTGIPMHQFESSENTTIQSVFDEISGYTGLIHHDHWKKSGPDWVPVSNLINEANLDTKLGLPVPLVITHSAEQTDIRTYNMLDEVQITEEGEKWKNRVFVDCKIQNNDTVYSSVLPETWNIATMGLERIYQYCEELPPTETPASAQAWAKKRCEMLYSLLCTPTTTFEVPFWYKYDLQLFQKIQFVGFEKIPADTMRITELTHRFNDSEGDVCTVRCALDRHWAAARKLALILKLDSIALSDAIKRVVDKTVQKNSVGTVTGISAGGSVIYTGNVGTSKLGYASALNQ